MIELSAKYMSKSSCEAAKSAEKVPNRSNRPSTVFGSKAIPVGSMSIAARQIIAHALSEFKFFSISFRYFPAENRKNHREDTLSLVYIMISGSKGQKAVHACTIRLLNLGPVKHEEVAIYAVNQRIPNVLELRELLCSEAIRDIK